MKPVLESLLTTAARPLAFLMMLAGGAAAAPAQHEGPFDRELLLDNLKELLSADDDGASGAGEDDSTFRKELGPVVLRADLKLVLGCNGDPRGKGDDDLAVDLSAQGHKDDAKDAKDAGKGFLNLVAGGALDVEFGKTFEALSIEYEKDLFEAKPPKEFFAPKPAQPAKKSSLLVDLLSNDDLTVKVAGFTVRCGNESDPKGAFAKKALSNGGLLKDGIKLQFWAGPVPILVRGNAGLSVALGLGPVADLDLAAFGGEFEPSIYAYGWLSAGVGGAVGPFSVSAGVAGKLRFVDTTLSLEGGVCLHPTAVPYGSIRVECRAVQFEAQLFAHVQAMWFSRTFTWTFYRYRAGELEYQVGVTPRDDGWLPVAAPPETPSRPVERPAGPTEPSEPAGREPRRIPS